MLQELVKQHLSSVLITGAVAAVSAYVLWGGDHKWKRGHLRPSLENLGNNCFLNCVTQALSSVDSFYLWLKGLALEPEDGELSIEVRDHTPAISALLDAIKILRMPTDGSQSTSLRKVHVAMSEHGFETLFTQEDAYEAFQILISCIEQEGRSLLPKKQLFTAPVQGKFLISLECLECRSVSSKRIEPFDNINLHLSTQQSVNLLNVSFNSLRDMLHTYFTPETVSDVECENCTQQWGEVTKCCFKKVIQIAKAPKCLCIQINRTEFRDGSMTKNNQHVSFPIDSLDLTLFAYQALLTKCEGDEAIEQEPAVSRPLGDYEVVRTYNLVKYSHPGLTEGLNYTLKSVIVHHGTANGGHYVTYRKLDDKFWLYASDEVVRLVTWSELERQQVYLLFYERQTLPEVLMDINSPMTLPSTAETSQIEKKGQLCQDEDSEQERATITPPELISNPNSPPVELSHQLLEENLSRLQQSQD